jgi:hypothetical protein
MNKILINGKENIKYLETYPIKTINNKISFLTNCQNKITN